MSKKMRRLFSLLCVAAMLFSCASYSEEELPGSGASEMYEEMSAPEETYAEIPAWEEPAQEDPSGEEPAEEPGAEDPSGEEPAEEPGAEEPSGEEPAEEPGAEEPSGEEPAEEPGAEEPSGEEPAEDPGADDSAGEGYNEDTSSVDADIQVYVNGSAADSVWIRQYPGCSVVRLVVDYSQHLNLVLEADMDFVVSREYEPDYSVYNEPHYRYSENGRLVMKFDAQAGSYLLFVYAAEYNRTGTLNIRLLDDGWYTMYSAASRRQKVSAHAEEPVPAEDPAPAEESAPAEEPASAQETVSADETAPAGEPASADGAVQEEEPLPADVSEEEPAPAEGSGQDDEPAPAEEPAEEAVPAEGSEPAGEPAAADELSPEEAPAEEPADESVPADENEPAADGPVSGEETSAQEGPGGQDETAAFDSAVITVDVSQYLGDGEDVISLPVLFARAYDALLGEPCPGLTVVRNERPDSVPYALSDEFLRSGQVSVVFPGISLQGTEMKLTDSFDKALMMIRDQNGLLTIALNNYSKPEEEPAAQTPAEETAAAEDAAETSAEDAADTQAAEETAEEPSAEKAAEGDGTAAEETAGEDAGEEKAADETPDEEGRTAEEPAAEKPLPEPFVNPADLYVGFSISWDDEVPSFGSVAHLDAVLDGFENLDFSFQWQYSEDNQSWTNVEGETQRRMDTVITEENYLYYWRVMVYISVPAEG